VTLDAARRVGGGDICAAMAAQSDGRRVFAKTLTAAPAGFFHAEVRGLDLLRVDGGPPLPEVIAVGDDGLLLSWIEPGSPTPAAAEQLGRSLAAMHAAALPSFGADAGGFIGTLPLDNSRTDDWPSFYVQQRLAPYLGALDAADRAAVDAACERIGDLAGPPEPPARIHGDLWSGNVVWSADGRAWLVDAASAHGGHRETDLAMLALFGAPARDRILAAYVEVAPLADGWRERVALHQLHPLLVHATLFGGGYSARAADAARRALASG
jgi:fructosamine-3-kinase